MKKIHLLTTLLIGQLFSVQFLFASDTLAQAKSHFYQAKQELVNMLDGKITLNYELAITTIENAYLGNKIDLNYFNYSVDFHLKNIQSIIESNRDYSKQDFKRTLLETEEQKKEKYEKALANWAIFSYMTDTSFFVGKEKSFYNFPFEYSTNDPLGTIDWSNTQVYNLLANKKGNCFALVSLFKILSERLNSQAIICTAPGHIYIRHADQKGIYHNVELATRSFPGTGSMETLTYTTDEATKNGISLRELELKQSVALCLVYLAKGYEYKFNTRNDDFLLECAELALKYDSLNLNAMLLKAEVLEERLIAKNKTVALLQKDKNFLEYENYINKLFSLGYREMPMEMKNLVISRLRNEDAPYPVKDHTPKPNEHLGVKNDRYFTLSGGLFDEMMLTKPVEQYHRTHFDTKKKKISAFVPLDTTYNKYPIDLVVFAWQIDPLAAAQPGISPYVAFNNMPIIGRDDDGRFCLPCIILLAGILTAPSVAVAPTGRSSDRIAIQNAYSLQSKWLFGTVLAGSMTILAPNIANFVVNNAVKAATVASNPSAQFAAAGAASFTANLFYDGPDDPFPTPDPYGEFGKALGRLFRGPVDVPGVFKQAGVATFNFIKGTGNTSKTAVIGQGMDRVKSVAGNLSDAIIFNPSQSAQKEWNQLLEQYGGKQIPDEVVQGTQIFKENTQWIQNVKKEGYNVIDIGADGSGKSSSFYNLEQQTIYE